MSLHDLERGFAAEGTEGCAFPSRLVVRQGDRAPPRTATRRRLDSFAIPGSSICHSADFSWYGSSCTRAMVGGAVGVRLGTPPLYSYCHGRRRPGIIRAAQVEDSQSSLSCLCTESCSCGETPIPFFATPSTLLCRYSPCYFKRQAADRIHESLLGSERRPDSCLYTGSSFAPCTQ